MSDEPSSRGSQDRRRINVNQDFELRYWSHALGVSTAAIRAAVKAVGPIASDVRRELGLVPRRIGTQA